MDGKLLPVFFVTPCLCLDCSNKNTTNQVANRKQDIYFSLYQSASKTKALVDLVSGEGSFCGSQMVPFLCCPDMLEMGS